MPEITNTYTPADLLGWAEVSNDLAWSGDGSFTITTPGGNGTLRAECAGSIEVAAATDSFSEVSNATGTVVYEGELNLDDIPSDAVIQEVVLRALGESAGEAESTCQGNATQFGSGFPPSVVSANVNVQAGASLFFTNQPFSPFLGFGHNSGNQVNSDSDSGTGAGDPIAAGATKATDDTGSVTFLEPEFASNGLTKADFISLGYSTVSIQASPGGKVTASISFTGGTSTGKTATASGAAAGHIEITDWEFEITFFTEDVDTPLVEETFEDPSGYEFGGFHGSETPPVDVVIVIDISGIYFLDPTATHDTFYIRDGDQGTMDVKIPRPFARTAYLGD